jgi:hypothetical protein
MSILQWQARPQAALCRRPCSHGELRSPDHLLQQLLAKERNQ